MHDRQAYILLTIDVEDWFQVENFRQYIPSSSWSSYELRVEKNIYRLLDILDSKKIQSPALHYENTPSTQNLAPTSQIRATFFVLGWIAERLPHVVQEIHLRGHEIASHGYRHNLCNQISSDDLRRDLSKSKKLLENIIGYPVHGYRAPNFSINDEILKVIEECGYLYDSSYNSFSMHGRYGHLDLSQNCRRGIALKITSTKHQKPLPREIHDSDSEACLTGAKSKIKNQKSKIFYELPISNLKFAHQVFPWGGGGYFRLIPFPLFKIGIKFILGQENAYLFYFHPWEIDPDQPKVNDAPVFYKFRHYINLSKTHIKLSKLIENFTHCNFITCSQYLDEVRN
jgi:polysaccharide deacetylase family protein (PEP-CTERM system associated)